MGLGFGVLGLGIGGLVLGFRALELRVYRCRVRCLGWLEGLRKWVNDSK